MISNVLALEPARALHHEGKPGRAEVEASVRIIIRWSGDNPDRSGLIETPARVTRGFEESFVGYTQDPVAVLRKLFDEIDGYDEMSALANSPGWSRPMPNVYKSKSDLRPRSQIPSTRCLNRWASAL